MEHRTCTACGLRKSPDDYYRKAGGLLTAECKECLKARQRHLRDVKRAADGLPPIDRTWNPKHDSDGRECTICRQYKLWGNFNEITPASTGGRNARCRPCVSTVRARRLAEAGGTPYVDLWGDGWRICTTCNEQKSLDEFGPRKHGRDGRNSRCRTCVGITRRKYRSANRDEENRKARERDRRTGRHTKRSYGIDRKQWEAQIEAQRGRCAACGRLPRRRLVGDHCHKTGTFRGITCDNCNVGMGLAGDDPVLLRRLADWIEQGGKMTESGSEWNAKRAQAKAI